MQTIKSRWRSFNKKFIIHNEKMTIFDMVLFLTFSRITQSWLFQTTRYPIYLKVESHSTIHQYWVKNMRLVSFWPQFDWTNWSNLLSKRLVASIHFVNTSSEISYLSRYIFQAWFNFSRYLLWCHWIVFNINVFQVKLSNLHGKGDLRIC